MPLRLTVMAGGAAEDVATARAVMDDLCATYTHMGPTGAGQTTTLVDRMLCAIGFHAVAEAVQGFAAAERLGRHGGLDAAVRGIPRTAKVRPHVERRQHR